MAFSETIQQLLDAGILDPQFYEQLIMECQILGVSHVEQILKEFYHYPKKLTLDMQDLCAIPVSIQQLLELESLSVQRARLEKLAPHVFNELINLKHLELSYCSIRSLPLHIFDSLHSLESLSLRYTFIEELDDDLFAELHNLKELNLSWMLLYNLSYQHLRNLTQLNFLNISHLHNISQWSLDTFKGLHNLTYLQIDTKQLVRIPPQALVLPKLQFFLLTDEDYKINDAYFINIVNYKQHSHLSSIAIQHLARVFENHHYIDEFKSSTPYYMPIYMLHPSQLYINEDKLASVKDQISKDGVETLDPVPIRDLLGLIVSTDGHTRLFALKQLGYTEALVIWDYDDMDWDAYEICVQWCITEGKDEVQKLHELNDNDYKIMWLDRCKKVFGSN
ncbi:MAG: leucine-rich repeat protein [Candidatus Heimdallarchaeota archaeon]|nr:leucine-rich repeat protein [Candidatus Heimdallarchaeota archaeon]